MARRREAVLPPSESDPLWYKDAILYELHVRAFQDSNGDGIGDFRGLVEKLDYLQDLGVTALWLLPFYPSPLRDDGYDIAEYTSIHPYYGTLPDFKLFLREAHRRGLRVITELVVNHTSDQHPWFKRARRAPPGSPERDFYVWSTTYEKYHEARIIFKDFERSNWTWDDVAGAYYWHRFYHHQPDLNYDNPAVHAAVFKALDFWLGMGLDGLRLDAVPYLYEREGTNCENLPETHAFLRELRAHVDRRFQGRMLLAEANQWPEDSVAYFGRGDECHMAFHFPVMPRLFMAIRMEDRLPILDILQQTPAIPDNSQWALFLRNHDELTLEMVTDEDRDYMYRVYAQDPQARINLGIRRRLAPLLENHRGKIELMNGLLFSLPGTPVLYYGDEIGMGDNIYLGDRNGVRTPMQWSGERNAGFSRANPQRLYLPVIIDPEYHYEAVNVQTQQNNPNSLLWWMKHLLALRRQHQAFGRGTLEFLRPDNHKVLAFVRRYRDENILVVANLSRLVQCVELDLGAFRGMVPYEMFGRTPLPPVGDAPYFLTLGSYAFYWFTLEAPQPAALPMPAHDAELPVLRAGKSWDHVLRGKAVHALEERLPDYLLRCDWFVSNHDFIKQVELRQTIEVPAASGTFQVALLGVTWANGDPETYVLPLAFASGDRAAQVQASHPDSVIARLQVRSRTEDDGVGEDGILYDPTWSGELCAAIVEAIARRRRLRAPEGEVSAWPTPALRQANGPPDPVGQPTVLRNDPYRTVAVYGSRYVLKLFRRLEEGANPDLEMGQFLEQAGFRHALPLAGAVEFRAGQQAPAPLVVLKRSVPNQGNAWRYTLDDLSRYFERALARQQPTGDRPGLRTPLLDLAVGEVPPLAQEVIGGYLESARLLGMRTAEMHAALASAPDVPDFAPEPFSALHQRSLYQTARSQVRQVCELLRKRLKGMSEDVRAGAQELLGREEEVLRRAHTILDRKISAPRIRCHGDYHLAVVLYTGKDFLITNFEGNPARPLSDRRRKRAPLRDVAAMLRSFHYASIAALTGGHVRPEDVPALRPWARFWHRWVSAVFLRAYGEVAAQSTLLPRSREEQAVLLDFYLLKRALSELRFELDHHPERVKIPLRGLLELLEG
jgi:maltose alpha-D-glucosyltransferase/alpha-amylase